MSAAPESRRSLAPFLLVGTLVLIGALAWFFLHTGSAPLPSASLTPGEVGGTALEGSAVGADGEAAARASIDPKFVVASDGIPIPAGSRAASSTNRAAPVSRARASTCGRCLQPA
jgi:hypothetical protein